MKKIFSFLAAVLFAGSMMAEPITINATDVTTIESGATADLDVTLQGINIVWQGAYYNPDGSGSVDFRVYANKSMTLTAESNISKVEIAGYCKAGLTVTANAGTITTGASYASETTKGTLEDPLIVVDEIGATSVTLTCTKQMRAYAIRITFEGGDVTPTVNYYVAGSMNGWAADEAYMLTPNNQSLYEGEFTFAANDEFKVIGFDGTNTSWFPEGMGNNFVITEAGDYKITFNPAGNVEGWYEGFFNVVKKEEPVVPGEEINVTISSLTNPGQVLYADVIASSGYWDIYAFNDQYQIEISNISTTEAAGTYTIDDLDADFTYIVPAEGDTVHFTAGQVVLSITDGVVNVAGQLTGDDNNIYNVNLTYKDPSAEQTVNVNIPKGVLYDGYATYGLYAVYGFAEDSTYVQLAIWAEQGFQGEFTEDDLDNKYVGSGLKDAAGNTQQIYAAAITVTPGAIEGAYTITADLLCYNNTLYKVTMKIGEEQGIDNVDAAVKAIKRLVNGQVVIEKNNKFYNINGAVIR